MSLFGDLFHDVVSIGANVLTKPVEAITGSNIYTPTYQSNIGTTVGGITDKVSSLSATLGAPIVKSVISGSITGGNTQQLATTGLNNLTGQVQTMTNGIVNIGTDGISLNTAGLATTVKSLIPIQSTPATEAQVKEIYQLILRREGDPGGVSFWYSQKKTPAELADIFRNTDEYRNLPIQPVQTMGTIGANPGATIKTVAEVQNLDASKSTTYTPPVLIQNESFSDWFKRKWAELKNYFQTKPTEAWTILCLIIAGIATGIYFIFKPKRKKRYGR